MSDTVAAGQLRAFVERIERLEADIKEMNADKSEVYKEARGSGFDVKAVRQCVAARKLDDYDREEQDAAFDMYWEALTGGSRVHVHEGQQESEQSRKAGPFSPLAAHGADKVAVEVFNQETGVEAERDRGADEVGRGEVSHPRLPSDRVENKPDAPAVIAGEPIPEPFEPPAFLVKAAKPLRPLCLNPSECAGYGSHTCHRCLKAAGQAEVAA